MSREPASLRAYRAATHLYPRSFRQEYGPDLIALAQQQLRDEPARRVGPRLLLDLVLSIPTQHLEAHMKRTPSALVPLLFLALALAGLLLAILGGTEPTTAVVGSVVAVVFGGLAVVAWRRSAPFRTDGPPISRSWWKLLIVGFVLLAIGGIQNQYEFGNWFVWILMVLMAMVLTVAGIVLALVELAHRARGQRPTPA